jgi:release factor glutamine methyltransferase
MHPPELHNAASRPTSVAELLREARATLGAAADPDAQLLLAPLLPGNRASVIGSPERRIPVGVAARYRAWVARRAAGEPLAYILGHKEFWSLELHVTPAVLVPRPETELLVERALALGGAAPVSLVDLGTGSGAIAIAVASERAHWRIVAVERSGEALQVARANAQRLVGDRIEFLHGDWLAPLAGRQFDLIVANPPYVAGNDPRLADPALRHEPQAALTPGGDGLDALRAIIDAAPTHLAHGGWLVLEHGAEQAPQLAAQLVARGFIHVRSHRDLAGHDRVIEARWGSAGAAAPAVAPLRR